MRFFNYIKIKNHKKWESAKNKTELEKGKTIRHITKLENGKKKAK
jgi:hypothetical protein